MNEPLTVVEWDDTTCVAAWLDRPEVAGLATDGAWRCHNVGWLVYEDDDCVVLSARRSGDSQRHVGLSERIPKRAIVGRLTVPSPLGVGDEEME